MLSNPSSPYTHQNIRNQLSDKVLVDANPSLLFPLSQVLRIRRNFRENLHSSTSKQANFWKHSLPLRPDDTIKEVELNQQGFSP